MSAAVASVDANETNINAVVANATNINTVAGIAANVTAVAGISASVSTVAGLDTEITAIYTDLTALLAVPAAAAASASAAEDAQIAAEAAQAAAEAAAGGVLSAVASDVWGKVSTKIISVETMWDAAAEQTVTYGASVALDFNTFINAKITLTGNITLAQPTNTTVGQSGCIRLIQDATGSRTVAFHADWKFAGGTDPTASTAANSVDLLYYHVVAANVIHASLNKAIS
jgi:hypothetical protein